MRRRWLKEEESYLKSNYKSINTKELANYLNRTIQAVNRRLYLLKLSKTDRWLSKEVGFLKNNYEFKSNNELSKELDRTEVSIYNKANRLGLYKDESFRIEHLTSINKKIRRDLNYVSVSNIAKQFKTKSQFEKMDGGAYGWCRINDCIDDVCSHMIPQRYSTPQLMCKFIFDILVDEECEYNTRKIIRPYELDLYYPTYRLAIEYNGKYWHSSVDNTELKKELCEEQDIKLLIIEEKSVNYEKDIKDYITMNLKELNMILNKHITQEDVYDIIINNDIFEKLVDIDNVLEITNKYDLYSDFYKDNKSLARKLSRLNLSEKYTSHMYKQTQVTWNIEKVREELKKYSTINELRYNNYGCYVYINRNDLKELFVEFNYKTRFNKVYVIS